MTVLVQHVHLKLAEAPTEGDELRFVDALVGEDAQHVPVKRLPDFRQLGIVELREIDAVQFDSHDVGKEALLHTGFL